MYTSDKRLLRQLTAHLVISGGFALFGAVYERFSHEVYSYWMIYAFAFPLLLCALPYALCLRKSFDPGEWVMRLWNAAVLTWTVGAVFKGVLDIYGTTNRLLSAYPAAGAILASAAVIRYIYGRSLKGEKPDKPEAAAHAEI